MPEQRCEWQSLSLRQRRLSRLIVLVGISSLLWWGIIWLLVHMLFSLVRIHFGAGAMLMTKRARCPTSIDAYRLDQMFTGAKPNKMPQRCEGRQRIPPLRCTPSPLPLSYRECSLQPRRVALPRIFLPILPETAMSGFLVRVCTKFIDIDVDAEPRGGREIDPAVLHRK